MLSQINITVLATLIIRSLLIVLGLLIIAMQRE